MRDALSEAERRFATGDRGQFTAPYRERHAPNRELGTVERINANGQLVVAVWAKQTCVAYIPCLAWMFIAMSSR